VAIVEMLHERTLKHRPVSVPVGTDAKVSLVPDAFVVPRVETVEGPFRFPMCFEIDMATTDRKAWQRKIRAYIAVYGDHQTGPLLTSFGVRSLTVAVATPKGEARRVELQAWTEAVLAEVGKEHYGELFRFVGEDAPELSPWEFFTAPLWTVPFQSARVPLLEPKGGA
jgi:hypothetical protein